MKHRRQMKKEGWLKAQKCPQSSNPFTVDTGAASRGSTEGGGREIQAPTGFSTWSWEERRTNCAGLHPLTLCPGKDFGIAQPLEVIKGTHPRKGASERPVHWALVCMIRIDFFLNKNRDHEAITHCGFPSVYKDNTTSLQTIQTVQKDRRKDPPLNFPPPRDNYHWKVRNYQRPAFQNMKIHTYLIVNKRDKYAILYSALWTQ